jgi:hypothetical protein
MVFAIITKGASRVPNSSRERKSNEEGNGGDRDFRPGPPAWRRGREKGADSSSAKSGQLTVAYMTPALHIPFWKDVSDGIHQEAEKIGGIKIIDSDSRLSAATQLKERPVTSSPRA